MINSQFAKSNSSQKQQKRRDTSEQTGNPADYLLEGNESNPWLWGWSCIALTILGLDSAQLEQDLQQMGIPAEFITNEHLAVKQTKQGPMADEQREHTAFHCTKSQNTHS